MKKKKINLKIFYTLALAFSIVAFWRGIWGLMDLYLFPNNLCLSFIISALLGIVLLYSIKHSLKSLI